MRRILTLLLTLILMGLAAQEIDTIQIIDPIESQPIFPGGENAFWCYLEGSLNFEILNSCNQSGRVFTFFIIDSVGEVKNLEINPDRVKSLKSIVYDKKVIEEIVRVINLMPRWKPAQLGGKNVPIRYSLPIKIPYTDFRCIKNSKK